MIQCLWSINNFKGYPPELQVSCMGVSKMISHMQQHFTDGNNLLITVCYPLSSKSYTPAAAQPPQVQNCFLLLTVQPSRRKIALLGSLRATAVSVPEQICPELPVNTSVMVVLQGWEESPAPGVCAAGPWREEEGHWEAHCLLHGWALTHGAGGTTELLCTTGKCFYACPRALSSLIFQL